MKYGIQLYSMRDLAQNDFEGAVKKASQIGYKMIEFAGFFGRSADDVNKVLAENNIELFGTHTSLHELIQNYDETVAFHKAIGNKNYIIPFHDLSDQTKIDEFCALVNKYQPMLEKEGIRLAFHNHSGEFKTNADGSVPYKVIVEKTSLFLEIDTFWVFHAGLDPIETLEKYKDRLLCIHLKDGLADGKGMPLGKGQAPVASVYKKAVEMGLDIIVESETLTPSGAEECTVGFEFLKSVSKGE